MLVALWRLNHMKHWLESFLSSFSSPCFLSFIFSFLLWSFLSVVYQPLLLLSRCGSIPSVSSLDCLGRKSAPFPLFFFFLSPSSPPSSLRSRWEAALYISPASWSTGSAYRSSTAFSTSLPSLCRGTAEKNLVDRWRKERGRDRRQMKMMFSSARNVCKGYEEP